MACVYEHIREDTGQVFYVGMAWGNCIKRAKEKCGRSKLWRNITNKTSYTVNIVECDISKEEAKALEMKLIAKYKRRADGGSLANLTIGGEGCNGIKGKENHRFGKKLPLEHSEKMKKTIRERMSKKVICVDTGEIFPSLIECATKIGVGKVALSLHISKNLKPRCNSKIKKKYEYYKDPNQ